jgi:hypothetical protein
MVAIIGVEIGLRTFIVKLNMIFLMGLEFVARICMPNIALHMMHLNHIFMGSAYGTKMSA